MAERDDLLAVVLASRDALHPGIDDMFLAEVLAAEDENPEDAAAAMRAVEAAADRALARVPYGTGA